MDKELAESIGAAAREARKALELTQEDAAERIGVSAEFYARIERGNALPSVPTFSRISLALGISADTLLGYREDGSGKMGTPSWGLPEPPKDPPEVRRLIRRLRQATPGTMRLVALLLKEVERAYDSVEDDQG
ncbi:helix-turn-helix domain-containing protein [Haliangium sp.]|uniref:helix-turn-helix domain-containing protein n=1 Tax=Haliangium sp. TaxID=2663208 RepID=UPI003D132448